MIVAANGALQQIPFSLLPTASDKVETPEDSVLFLEYRSVPWLANRYAITVLPTLSSLGLLRNRTALAAEKPFVGFGDPYFNRKQAGDAGAGGGLRNVASVSSNADTHDTPVWVRSTTKIEAVESASINMLPRLPETADELRSIARALAADEGTDLYLGDRANEDLVKDLDLAPYRVVAFATHGLVAGDLNGLFQPALALSAPEVTGGEEDGLLTMSEILNLSLNADWVVLSACNTAASDGRGAEAVSGLGQAFFYAGTRALLVSNWPVHSLSTMELTSQLFTELAETPTLSRSEALRRARTHLIKNSGERDQRGELIFSYAHPIFWAPFTVVGDGGID